MKVIGLILTMGLIIFLEIPRLIPQKRYKELFIFIILITVGFGAAILQATGFELPNPNRGIELIVRQFLTIKFSYQ